MKVLPTQMSGLEGLQWLYDNPGEHYELHVDDDYGSHMIRREICSLVMYYLGRHVGNKPKNSLIQGHAMNLSLNILMEHKWKVVDTSVVVKTEYNDLPYDITGCTDTRCGTCKYAHNFRNDEVDNILNQKHGEYVKQPKYDDHYYDEIYIDSNYTKLCILCKGITHDIRKDWCVNNEYSS